MPQVPYSGVQQVGPTGPSEPRYSADTPIGAFGGASAAAIGSLGKAVEGAGNEIFQRGIAMQDLYNHSQALEADAKYSQAAGEIWEKMRAKQGKNAVDYYTSQDYSNELRQVRETTRNSLDNPMAQKLFDSSTLSTFTRLNLYGAGHSGTENKRYATEASGARVKTINDQILSNPQDEKAFQDGLAKSEQEVRAQAQLAGIGPDAESEAVAQTRSQLWSQRITGMAKSAPLQAGKLLDDAVKSGGLRGADIAKVTNLVQQARNTVGARMISHDVSTGAGTQWGQGEIDIKQAQEAIGQIESGGNYSTVGVQTSHGRALGKYQVMEEFLPEFLSKAGLPAMSRDEFLKDHAAQDQVFSANFGAYMKKTGSANDAASMWLTGKPLAEAGGAKDAFGTDAKEYVRRFNAALAKGAPLSAKVAMGAKAATEQAPDDPLFPDYVEQRITTDHNRAIAVKRDDEFQNRQVIETGLMGQEGGKLPTTIEELTADPKVEQAWNALLPSARRRYMSVLAKNSKGDHNWTDTTLKAYQGFKGMAQANPAEFLDQDVIGSDLPNSAKRELINLQASLKGKAEGDPRVQRALNILKPDMQAAGIDPKDKDGYYQFTGALADQLQEHTTQTKKQPTIDEVRTIGSRLLQSQTQPGWLWNSKVPTYQVPVPKDEAEKIKLDPTWAGLGIEPTDVQIQRIYTRKLYQDLYGGAPKSASAAPSVPVSK